MHTIEATLLSPGNYILQGDLVFNNINKASIKLVNFTQSATTISIDLQRLGKIDSAGLALLIEWVKNSHLHNKKLRFNNIPAQLTALAKLSYLSEIDLFNEQNN